MAAKPPKPWKLTEDESFASFTSWQHNLVYNLSCDTNFQRFLAQGATWTKASASNPHRGLTDDGGRYGMRAAQKAQHLHQMLGLITQWVPHYLATDIISNSTSMDSIWQSIRKYYGFQQSEAQFMKFTSISWEEGERPERLYQRLLAHMQDNLLCSGSRLKHNGSVPVNNEEMSPTVERLVVLRWMELIHPSLPSLVQRTFAHDLQTMTLKDLQPQIVDALDGFLEELRQDDVRASRVFMPTSSNRGSRRFQRDNRKSISRRSQYSQHAAGGVDELPSQNCAQSSRPIPAHFSRTPKNANPIQSCRVCRAEGRPYVGHNYFSCDYVSKAEKRNTAVAHQVHVDEESDVEDDIIQDDLADESQK